MSLSVCVCMVCMCLCVYRSVGTHEYKYPWRPEALDPLASGNRTQVLWKNRALLNAEPSLPPLVNFFKDKNDLKCTLPSFHS